MQTAKVIQPDRNDAEADRWVEARGVARSGLGTATSFLGAHGEALYANLSAVSKPVRLT